MITIEVILTCDNMDSYHVLTDEVAQRLWYVVQCHWKEMLEVAMWIHEFVRTMLLVMEL